MGLMCMLFGIVVLCGLLCVIEALVEIWDKADRRRAKTSRVVPISAVRPARPPVVRQTTVRGSLPDRDSIGKIYSLSDHFADRFCEVVNS